MTDKEMLAGLTEFLKICDDYEAAAYRLMELANKKPERVINFPVIEQEARKETA